MAMTRAQWEAKQKKLPAEDRTSYEEYLATQGAFAPSPSATAAAESGTIGAASIASQMSPQITETIQNIPTPAAVTAMADTPPTEGLKEGYEWYKFNKAGGGFEWRQRPTRATLVTAYTQLGSGGGGGGGAGGAGGATDTGTTTPAQTYTAPDGKIFTDLNAYNAYLANVEAENKRRAGQSAYDLLFEQFNALGLGALVEPLKGFIVQGLSPAEFTLRLRDTDAYKKRFAANAQRIANGLRALSEAEYIGLEDAYQEKMRQYGLPPEYYARGEMGRQPGFEKFISGDISPVELEDRLQTGYNRVLNAAPQIKDALTQYYGSEITNGDILAYVLDPEKAIENIKRKVTAAEIGGAAAQFGLGIGRERAERLGSYNVGLEAARKGFEMIANVLPRAGQLSQFYKGTPYTQTTAEEEVFALPGAIEAGKQRRRLTELEQASFSGQAGVTGGALARDRAGAI